MLCASFVVHSSTGKYFVRVGHAIFAAGLAAFDVDAGVPRPLPGLEALAHFLLPKDAAVAIKLR